jgi:hypothetical protein
MVRVTGVVAVPEIIAVEVIMYGLPDTVQVVSELIVPLTLVSA